MIPDSHRSAHGGGRKREAIGGCGLCGSRSQNQESGIQNPKSPAIRIRDLTVQFGDYVVLETVSLDVTRGSTTGIIGPNGAGKTTLFHALTGDLPGSSGRVEINGQAMARRNPSDVARLGLGKLFQDVRVFANLTARENLLVAAHENGERAWHRAWLGRAATRRAAQQRADVAEILERIGLSAEADQLAGSLSYGNQKTLAIGRLLAGRFSILLLDEPMAGLSPQRAQRVSALIDEIATENGLTVLLIEHNMEHVRQLCERTVALNRGRVFADGATASVLDDPSVREICLGL